MFQSNISGVPFLQAALMLVFCCGIALAQAPMQKPALSVRIELRSSAPPAGNVVLRNNGSVDIRVWRRGNSWGDNTVTFQVHRGGSVQKFSEKPRVYTRNIPAYITLAPGQTQEIPFDLSASGGWEPAWQPGPSATSGGTLAAVYKVAPTKELAEFGVWTGEIASAPVKLD